MTSKIVSFTLNGRETEVIVKPLTTLQKLLREQLGFTATKAGCKQGGCGSWKDSHRTANCTPFRKRFTRSLPFNAATVAPA
jgi:aerobic-type carbon monoxide dehydrogenase small subunit (CoxS/CutS family)